MPGPRAVARRGSVGSPIGRHASTAALFTSRRNRGSIWVSHSRSWFRTSATRTVGERYCLTAHAAGFIDALYSRGLTNTFEVVNSLAWRLIEASRDGDWSTERFAYIDRLQQGLFDVHDDVVYSSFVGFRDYDLWNAVTRVWKATSIMPTMSSHARGLPMFRP